MTAPSPSSEKRGPSVGTWIGMSVAIVLTIVLGIAGAYAGYSWGYALGPRLAAAAEAAGQGSGGDPDSGDAPDEVPLGHLVGDLPLDRDVTVDPSPAISVAVDDVWEFLPADDPDDPDELDQYYDADTQCYLTVEPGTGADVPRGESDASASRTAIDEYVKSMGDDDTLTSVEPGARDTAWIDVNEGKGRIEFEQARVDYVYADDDSEWMSVVMVRVFSATRSLDYLYLDCPADLGADGLADAVDDAQGALSVRG